MQPFIRQLWATVRRQRLFSGPGRVVVAVSGGPDSTALLLGLRSIATRLGVELIVGHVDHGLRPDTGPLEAATVADLGGRLGLPVEIECADLGDRPPGTNLEEAAREARYARLAAIAARHGAGVIAVGHTADDQAETLLMRLMRGAGPHGLAAMTPISHRPELRIVRPLLAHSRAAVMSYLQAQQIVAQFDRTNRDVTLSRNRVRHILLPMLKRQFNPRIVETLGRTADLMEEVDRFMVERAAEVLERVTIGGAAAASAAAVEHQAAGGPPPAKVELDLPRLASYDPILRRYALRLVLGRLRGDLRGIGYEHVRALVELCRPRATGHRVELPGGALALREGKRLTLWLQPPTPLPAVAAVELPIPGELRVPGTTLAVVTRTVPAPREWAVRQRDRGTRPAPVAWFDLAQLEPPLCIRSRLPGDRISGMGLPGETKIKRLLIDAGIPRRLRAAVPVLTDRQRVLWVVGVRRSKHGLLHDRTEQVLEVTLSSPMFRLESPSRSTVSARSKS